MVTQLAALSGTARYTAIARTNGRTWRKRVRRNFPRGIIMSEAATPAPPAQKLAELIYVELIGRAFLRVDNAAVIKPDPESIAKLSIQLAEVFQKADKTAQAAMGPKNVGYDVQLADIGTWNK
jgi:hypothetical protein